MVYDLPRLGRWWPLDRWTVPLLLPAIFTFPPDVRGLPWGCRCADGRGRSGEEYKTLRGCQSLVSGAGSSLGVKPWSPQAYQPMQAAAGLFPSPPPSSL